MSTVRSAFIELLKTSPAITSLLGVLEGSSIPVIFSGIIPETAKNMPALCLTGGTGDILASTLNEQNYNLNVYAETEDEAEVVRNTIMELLDDTACTILGVTMRLRLTGSVSVPNPTETEVNAPLAVRVTYWGD